MPTIQFTNIANEAVTAEVISLSGEVVDINRSTQTHLHASGGGAYASSGNGRATASASPISISSTNSVHDDVYLLTESGEEVFVPLLNWEKAGIRKGHHIQILSFDVNINNRKQFPIDKAVINNRSLNRVVYKDNLMDYMVNPITYVKTFLAMFGLFSPLVQGLLALVIIFCFFTVILIPVALGIIWYLSKNMMKKLPALVNTEVKPKLQAHFLPPITNK